VPHWPDRTPFPDPAHRTGRADFPHPALGEGITPLWRGAPPAASGRFQELPGSSPIPRPSPLPALAFNQGPFPPPPPAGLPRYYGPLRHPVRPGLALAGVRLAVTRRHHAGLPVLRPIPFADMPPPLPRHGHAGYVARPSRDGGSLPRTLSGSARALYLSRLARRSLALPSNWVAACRLAESPRDPLHQRLRRLRRLRRRSPGAPGLRAGAIVARRV